MKKLILDTNWWISFIISKNSGGLPDFFFGNILFCFSAELAVEIRSVLQYDRIVNRINSQNLEAYLFFEQNIARFFNVVNDVTICRDKKDNFLLALSTTADEDFLITNDEDLLVLQRYGSTQILTLKEFAALNHPQQ
jgi:putative PIN family toxin of toxin-antitoxin system